MGIVNIIGLTHGFSGGLLFEKVGFQVEPNDRIGLVGANGSGKTTLLKLIHGDISPEAGEIHRGDGTRVGYLPQDVYEQLTGELLQSVIDSVPGRVSLREAVAHMEEHLKGDLSKAAQMEGATRLAELHQALSDLGARYPIHEAEKILIGLGFQETDFRKPVSSLSGGWKMRAALASLLYQAPDLLLMDEPTNHLDIPSLRWVDQFLMDYQGAIMLVCHDREFLNRQIRRVISFEPEGVRFYAGNYEVYLKAREEEKKTLEARARNQELKIKEAKKFIDRFKAKSSKARQAQSKIKLIRKMKMVETHRREKTIRFAFPPAARCGRVVINIQGLSKSFGRNTLYEDFSLDVLRGERVAIIGPNGAGKTTLLRMITGEIPPDKGEIRPGHGVTMSYYAQHHTEMLEPNRTIVEEVYQVVPHESVTFVRQVCGAFLFSGEDVDKPVGVLSGGEKARVCLAKILVRPGNLLVMDEPTNHLDLLSSETLIDALGDYSGTILFVSHNRSFINRLATKILDIQTDEVVVYPGTLKEYEDHLARLESVSGTAGSGTAGSGKAGESAPDTGPGEGTAPSQRGRRSQKEIRREKAEKRRLVNKTLKPIEETLRRLESDIAVLERREKEIEKILVDPEIFKQEEGQALLAEYGRIKKKLEDLMEGWEDQQQRLASARAALGIDDPS